MEVFGIIAEFNPLHNGHKYLINEARKHGFVVCAISGNFVQRGDTAFFDKRLRTEAALSCGADLVIELPVCYSMSTAQNFALGGVSMLSAIGCDTLMFGSECGDVEGLIKTADILCSQSFKDTLPEFLENGTTFAAARQKAAEKCGAPKNILNGANNNLAIEYIIAAKSIGTKMNFKTVKRMGAMHDSNVLSEEFASASALRNKIKSNSFKSCKTYFPNETYTLFETAQHSDIYRLETAILSSLRSKSKSDFSHLPDLSEGVENKLYSQIKTATSLDNLYENLKVKRYTLARIRRLVLSAFLGIDNRLFLKQPPYMRILGFNKNGEEILRQNKANSPIPVIMRVGEIDDLGDNAKYMFEIENRATDLYALSFENPLPCGIEYNSKLIKYE